MEMFKLITSFTILGGKASQRAGWTVQNYENVIQEKGSEFRGRTEIGNWNCFDAENKS